MQNQLVEVGNRIPDQLVVKEVVPWALRMPIQKILRPDVI